MSSSASSSSSSSATSTNHGDVFSQPLVGVLALQGAFIEHQRCLEAVGCRTRQVRAPKDLQGLDGLVLPGGESTAMGLIGTSTTIRSSHSHRQQQQQQQPHRNDNNAESNSASGTSSTNNMWTALQDFCLVQQMPVWGTCAGLILLAEHCIGTSAVIQHGQALIGGMHVTVCRNYFGTQISSFEVSTPAPPTMSSSNTDDDDEVSSTVDMDSTTPAIASSPPPFPGVFIRAPAILDAGPTVTVLGHVTATPCRQAVATLSEWDRMVSSRELIRMPSATADTSPSRLEEEKKSEETSSSLEQDTVDTSTTATTKVSVNDGTTNVDDGNNNDGPIVVPRGGLTTSTSESHSMHARTVICAARQDNLLGTVFHPELTSDLRWHEYFVKHMVLKNISQNCKKS